MSDKQLPDETLYVFTKEQLLAFLVSYFDVGCISRSEWEDAMLPTLLEDAAKGKLQILLPVCPIQGVTGTL